MAGALLIRNVAKQLRNQVGFTVLFCTLTFVVGFTICSAWQLALHYRTPCWPKYLLDRDSLAIWIDLAVIVYARLRTLLDLQVDVVVKATAFRTSNVTCTIKHLHHLSTAWYQLTWLPMQWVFEHIDGGDISLLQLCLQFPVLPLRSLPALPTVYTMQAAFRRFSTSQTCLQQRKTEISEFHPEKHMHTDRVRHRCTSLFSQTHSYFHFYVLTSCCARLLLHWHMHLC